MGEAALREAILEATLMPPDFRLAQVFELVETVNDFDAKVPAAALATRFRKFSRCSSVLWRHAATFCSPARTYHPSRPIECWRR